jgi:hypothetical protein
MDLEFTVYGIGCGSFDTSRICYLFSEREGHYIEIWWVTACRGFLQLSALPTWDGANKKLPTWGCVAGGSDSWWVIKSI